jgi:hypothetical protein
MEWNLTILRRFRRHWPTVLAAVAMTAVVTVISFVVIGVQEPRFGKEKFELLHEGMTEAEVVEVLGCPAGDYRPTIWKRRPWPPSVIGVGMAEKGRPCLEELEESKRKDVEKWMKEGRPIPNWPHIEHRIWWAREYGIDVDFDDQGRLIHCTLMSLVPPSPWDVIRRVRWWIGW